MCNPKLLNPLFSAACMLLGLQVVDAADLKMRIVWQGDLPKLESDTAVSKDCKHLAAQVDRQFVNLDSKGVREAVVYVSPAKNDRERWRQPPRKQTVLVEVRDCHIQPHIAVAQAGDTLTIDERDGQIGHNLNFLFMANSPMGAIIPVQRKYSRPLDQAESAAVTIECSIHSHERAYLFVLEHSFVAISDKQGDLLIRGLPDNCEVPLKLFHEHGKISSAIIHGERQILDRGKFKIHVTESVTDLGEVGIDAQSFSESP